MRKVIVSVQECQLGMKIAETIYNEYGAIIVAEGTILDQHIINKLKNLEIEKIRIYDEAENLISANSSELFRAQYNENLETVKEVLHDISNGKNIDVQKVNTVTESIYSRINENRDIVSCINQIRGIDEYTYTHSVNVSLVSMLIGKWLKLDSDKVQKLVQAGLLHDIGKSRVPVEILNKPGALTPQEFEEIKKHTVHGYNIIMESSGMDKELAVSVLMHHEREDGSGYPTRAMGRQISEYAKILAVADIYDAMTSDRAYREKDSPFEVFEMMEKSSFGYLDTRVVNAFLTNIAAYYIGDIVQLNTGDIGEIIYINPRAVSKPLIRIGSSFVDLSLNTQVKIMEMI